MTDKGESIAATPVWVDLASPDVEASGSFYAKLFGWRVDISPDPEYGGYAMATLDGKDAAGIGPKQMPEAPTAWSVYIGTSDADALEREVSAAGGTVVAPAFDVGEQGRMTVFQDPAGAFLCAWQPNAMRGFLTDGPNAFAWAELNARGVKDVLPFYTRVFGWSTKITEMGEGQAPYTEFQVDGDSIAGGSEMDATVPAFVPNYWLVYFAVDDVDASHQTALDGGATEMVAPMDFPGGRFAIVTDPQGASFGLLKTQPRG